MFSILVLSPAIVIPVLFLRARIRWLTGAVGKCCFAALLLATVAAVSATFFFGQPGISWIAPMIIVTSQWALVIFLHYLFVAATGYEPRDVYLARDSEVDMSTPDRIFGAIGSLVLLIATSALAYYLGRMAT